VVTGSGTRGPSAAKPKRPAASIAAAGPSRSRPWNVADSADSPRCSTSSARTSIAASPASSGASRPLSGAIQYASCAATASSRRLVPTPGSTTARCTVPDGKRPTSVRSRNAPAAMSCAGTSCVTSTNWTFVDAFSSAPFRMPT
jgi:hypothetical protein